MKYWKIINLKVYNNYDQEEKTPSSTDFIVRSYSAATNSTFPQTSKIIIVFRVRNISEGLVVINNFLHVGYAPYAVIYKGGL